MISCIGRLCYVIMLYIDNTYNIKEPGRRTLLLIQTKRNHDFPTNIGKLLVYVMRSRLTPWCYIARKQLSVASLPEIILFR